MYEQITIPLIEEPESTSDTPLSIEEIVEPLGAVVSSLIADIVAVALDTTGASLTAW